MTLLSWSLLARWLQKCLPEEIDAQMRSGVHFEIELRLLGPRQEQKLRLSGRKTCTLSGLALLRSFRCKNSVISSFEGSMRREPLVRDRGRQSG